MYVRHTSQNEAEVFEYIDWHPIPPDGFLVQSRYYFELTDDARASVIKRAHDLEACLVEFHSHTGLWPATFSASDLIGLQEFVPHVWWRLEGKPYLAIVVTQTGFDGLAWITNPQSPQYLDGIVVEGSVLIPTQLSPLGYNAYEQ